MSSKMPEMFPAKQECRGLNDKIARAPEAEAQRESLRPRKVYCS